MGQLKPVEIELNPAEPASAVLAINKMAEIEDSPLPKGTKARTVRFEGGLATVDLTKEVMEIAGDRSEALMFNAILATLGQFPDVRQVQFLVEGEKTQIGGTKDTLEPLNVPSEFVRTATNTATP
jgi:spore germination protein GerM